MKNKLIAIALLIGCIIVVLITGGLLLPILLPVALYSLKLMGVNLDA